MVAAMADAATLVDQLLDTWRIHARVQRYVLDAVPAEALAADSGLKGRTVGEQFAHLHDVRLLWLTSAAPDALAGLTKLGRGEHAHDDLRAALDGSAAAIGTLLRAGLADGRVKGFKPHPVAFLGYLIAHESYHQGDIGVRLTQSGHRLDQKVGYGMWEWGSR